MRKYTYLKWHVSTKKLPLLPCQEARKARRKTSAHPSQTQLASDASPVGCIWISRFSDVLNSAEDERVVWGRTVSCNTEVYEGVRDDVLPGS